MDRIKVASELVKVAKELTARDLVAEQVGDFPYAVINFTSNYIKFTIASGIDMHKTGTQTYWNDPTKAIRYVLELIEKSGVKPQNVEVV